MSHPDDWADEVIEVAGLELDTQDLGCPDDSDDPEELRGCLRRVRVAAQAERECREERAVVAEIHVDPERPFDVRISVATPTGDRAHEREVASALLRHAAAHIFRLRVEAHIVDRLRWLVGEVQEGRVEEADAWGRVVRVLGLEDDGEGADG